MTAPVENPRKNVADVFNAWKTCNSLSVGPVSTDGVAICSYGDPLLSRALRDHRITGYVFIARKEPGRYSKTTATHLSSLHELLDDYRKDEPDVLVAETDGGRLARAVGAEDWEELIIRHFDEPLRQNPQKNPRTSADYEAMLEEAVQWAQHKKFDRKILMPALRRVPEANDIRADRLFWVGDVIEAIDVMAHNDKVADASFRAALKRINDADWWQMTGRRMGRAHAVEIATVEHDRQRRDYDPGRTTAHEALRERVNLKRVQREYEAGGHARAREMEDDFEENPPWVTRMLAESMVSLQEEVPPAWMPKLASTQPGRGEQFVGKIAEYGCGAYGCVMPTLDKDIVLKLSSDPSEAKFASELADTLPTDFCVHYHMMVKLEGQERMGREVFLIWRESAEDVGQIHKIVGKHAETLIRRQHRAAVDAYIVLAEGGDVDEYLEKLELWKRRCMEMAKLPELAFVATGMLRAWDEKGIFISDTHGGNLGRCVRNGELTWVITDPGNVVVSTDHADERSKRRVSNPVKRTRCERNHEALKEDDAQWNDLAYVGRQMSWDDDDNEMWLELRNCTCGSTLARPEKTSPTQNPKIYKPTGELKPAWQFIRECLRRRVPDPVAVAFFLPGRNDVIEGDVIDLSRDHKSVTVQPYKGDETYTVPIENIWISGTRGWNTLASLTTVTDEYPFDPSAPVKNPQCPKPGAVRFFEQRALVLVAIGQRRRTGRIRSARELAIAEYVLQEEHPEAVVNWYDDPDAHHYYPDENADSYFIASLEEPEGEQLNALGAIGDPDENYRRVVAAELALGAWSDRVEELAQQVHARRGRPLRLNPDLKPTVIGILMRKLMGETKHLTAETLAHSLDYEIKRAYGITSMKQRVHQEHYYVGQIVAHLLYLADVGLIEVAGNLRPEEEADSNTLWRVVPDVVKRAPKWPRDVDGESEANILIGAPDHKAVHQYQHAQRLHEFIKSFKDNKHWTLYWEFPGVLSVSHKAGPYSILVGSDTRNTGITHYRGVSPPRVGDELMLNISVIESDGGADVVDEEGYYEPWPKSSLEFMAVLQYFMDKYHP